MNTPIIDFINAYRANGTVRLHMPGHKGREQELLGFESWDITEIAGADELYEAEGIIAESESHATALFESGRTFFSTEGSSQCIRAMLRLAMQYETGDSSLFHTSPARPVILAARNVHKAFLYACALLDITPHWLYPEHSDSLCACPIRPEELELALRQEENASGSRILGVYLTSPDYLGNLADIAGLAEVCHRHGTLLLVDNAHGAYLHFLSPSLHPLDLGCDLCCDSAHKTLPVLTGGAYLHISSRVSDALAPLGKNALALFGSTSPSYLIMASLDRCNSYLADGYADRLAAFCLHLEELRQTLRDRGWQIISSDPLRITLRIPCPEGQTQPTAAAELKQKLRCANLEFEYADDDFIVFMLTPENSDSDQNALIAALGTNSSPYAPEQEYTPIRSTAALTVREAVFAPHLLLPSEAAVGRICASPAVSCPPAIPIVCSGEVITEEAVRMFKRYHIDMIDVVR